MGACAPGCVRDYFFEDDLNIQGNKIFKKMNTNLNIEKLELTEEEKKSLTECTELMKEAEAARIKISKKFESFLYHTGACVLTKPNMERGLISFIINILTQIYICSFKKKLKFGINDFSLSDSISISNNPPFIELNASILDTLKKKYGFDFHKNKILKSALDSIIDFLSSIPRLKTILENQLIVLKNLVFNSLQNLNMVRQITFGIDGIIFLIDFFNEISNGIIEAQLKIAKPSNIELYFRIAEDAAKNSISDPKEIVLAYSFGENCGNIEKWKENMTYKEYHQLKF